MDLRDGTRISHLLENLPDDKLACALKDDDLTGNIYRRRKCLNSARWRTANWISRKFSAGAGDSGLGEADFRLLAHLLRTLQHAGDRAGAASAGAVRGHYWTVAAPAKCGT